MHCQVVLAVVFLVRSPGAPGTAVGAEDVGRPCMVGRARALRRSLLPLLARTLVVGA